jgi:hypothetical protein
MRSTFLALIFIASSMAMPAVSAAERVATSAHGEALYLVLTDQAEALRRLDPDDEAHERSVRTWSVTRPLESDALDFANTFTVTLAIDGRIVAAWYVNTGEGTVEPRTLVAPVAATSPAESRGQ